MNKSFCIHPKDLSTEFLCPVFNEIRKFKDTNGVSGDSSDDDFYETINNALSSSNFDSFIFLGHGCSSMLYGNGFSELIIENDLRPVNDKTLILFACNFSQLLEKIGVQKGIGFGFIPSGQDDILHSTKFHHLDLSLMDTNDWHYIRNSYQKCWI